MSEVEIQKEIVHSPEDAGYQEPDENLETTEDVEALREKNRQLFARAKKAETELKEFRGKTKPAPAPGEGEKALGAPRERSEASPDYAEKFDRLTVRAEGIKDPEQIDFVLGASKRLGITVEEALRDELIQEKLKRLQDNKASEDALPSGSRRSTSPAPSFKDSVEYWVSRDDLPEDYELRKKVVRERHKRAKSSQGLPHYKL